MEESAFPEADEHADVLDLVADPLEDAALAEVVRDLRTVLLVPPAASVAASHLAAMRQAAVPLVASAPTGAPAVTAGWARRSTVAGGIAAAVLIGTAGLAAAGSLPDPVQRRVADVVGHLGIELPNPSMPAPATNPPAQVDVGGPAAPTPAAPTTNGALDATTTSGAANPANPDGGPPSSVPGEGTPGGPTDKTSPTVRGPADPNPGAPGPANPDRGKPAENPNGKPLPDNGNNGNPNPGNGNPNPGNGNPGNGNPNPGNENPGNENPGGGNPGNGNPGEANPGNGKDTSTTTTTTVDDKGKDKDKSGKSKSEDDDQGQDEG